MWTAKTMEGGASPDAYFQMLFNIVSHNIRLFTDLLPALAEAISMISIVFIVFSGLGLAQIGPLTILGLGLIGFASGS